MAVAVVDTNVLVGMADADDEHHDVAMEIVRGMDHGDLPTGRVTNYIVLETLNWIHDRKRHPKAVETYERLNQSAGFEVLHAARKDLSPAPSTCSRPTRGSRSGTRPSPRTCSARASSTCTPSTTTWMRSIASRGWKRRLTRSPDRWSTRQVRSNRLPKLPIEPGAGPDRSVEPVLDRLLDVRTSRGQHRPHSIQPFVFLDSGDPPKSTVEYYSTP